MCGIIGYTGRSQALPILIDGLSKLEYRGYDSAGVSVFNENQTHTTYRSAGKLSELQRLTETSKTDGMSGIGHTRWATHGEATAINAHPHSDTYGNLSVVHNGIVENYLELKEELTKMGHIFSSDTDSETIPHLIEHYMNDGATFEEATGMSVGRIRGANAVVVMCNDQPEKIVAFRTGNAGGLIIGYGKDEMLVASDIPAILSHTNTISHMRPGELAILEPNSITFRDNHGNSIEKERTVVANDPLSMAKGDYRHFMLKEICEQPDAIIASLMGRLSSDKGLFNLDDFNLSIEEIKKISKIILTGMGTSLHAAMLARLWMERIAGIPAEWDNSSEFRYREPILEKDSLFISISQSGETADTLAAMEEVREKNIAQITLCNYLNTQASHIADQTLQIRAGLEVAVAGTKTFTCSLVTLYTLAIYFGVQRKHISHNQAASLTEELSRLPEMIGNILVDQRQYEELASRYYTSSDFLFLGRGYSYPVAMEGALKLKEVSYIHAEGYPAGEMKHGPISLINDNMPVVALIPKDSLYEKMLNTVNEVKSRGAIVIAVASESDTEINGKVDHVIRIPDVSDSLSPIVATVPLQLISYYFAVRRGCDVDQPRNLAKSVTVE
ncbi:MAG TPA: glutamine--fructose-6-phosphate transaminase (isomerizing) [SAR202 cluster bacterium]|jgi:glucosamine--fructose-6-phosphate aminotransferase (isomerizing)|nr:glutamine--fructose-6-phosphate transaminase (isomerizing) [SAR202 cluster bacterium]|tara:strand:+ start:39597 stop:41441 length:1845 start_codon:yes stop_codon:yes gene_type:complete